MEKKVVPEYLNTTYKSKQQKGGTLIRMGVQDLATHLKLLSDPDGYRPDCYPGCEEGDRFHAHDIRERKMKDEVFRLSPKPLEIRRYKSVLSGAIFQVLPGFIPRYLQRSWDCIQGCMVDVGILGGAVERPEKAKDAWMPQTTLKRHVYRLTCCSVLIWRILFGYVSECPEKVRIHETTRAECLEILSEKKIIPGPMALSALSGLVHKIRPGVRVM